MLAILRERCIIRSLTLTDHVRAATAGGYGFVTVMKRNIIPSLLEALLEFTRS